MKPFPAPAGPPLPLEFLTEPAFLLRRGGEVIHANAAARRLLGGDAVGRNLFDHVCSEHEDLRTYLRRSAGSSAPRIGMATLQTAAGPTRYRLNCAALPGGSDAGPLLVLRCLPGRDDQFSLLGKRIQELNTQLRNRLREKKLLEEALRQNQNLLRELQHRVKNNIQMMLSLIQMSAKDRKSGAFSELVAGAHLRLQAMASTQDALLRAKRPGMVSASSLLEEIVNSATRGFGLAADVRLDLCDASVPNDLAHSLALIANELMVNALKHGLPNSNDPITVSLNRGDGELTLVVRDRGPGFPEDAWERSSGLKLVRGLCRQIGGALELTNEAGAKCVVRFRVDEGGRQHEAGSDGLGG